MHHAVLEGTRTAEWQRLRVVAAYSQRIWKTGAVRSHLLTNGVKVFSRGNSSSHLRAVIEFSC